ncbi:hypothetical protein NLU14_12945 [Marinobacter sp. 71-i]|uniref:Uncharacterized protein n=1 Tax=Marinobacter iranensis TaxID=2962607 RepID=A0ABT5YBR4_9GAMM|nr:hypothetical protein [Marinobacter iranensis]MDF0751132.1 hypothetical protein [Marinobacter iranensis]
MGILELPAPLFASLDQFMAVGILATVRLIIWGSIGAVVTMGLYKLFSPQAKIGHAKRAAQAARRRLYEFDGELADAGPLIRGQFIAAFKHIGLVVPASLLAMFPLLCLLVWLDTTYGQSNVAYLPVGPEWGRSWMAVFFPVMVMVSLLIYRWARIE